MSFVELLIFGATAGLGATVLADLVGVLRQGWGAIHGFYCLVGRWVRSLSQRGFAHDDIRISASIAGEAAFGWCAHVLLGIVCGIGFAFLFGSSAFDAPRIWQGLSFGLVTVLVPWLIFQPLFGWGFPMSKAPNPWKMRMKGVINHAVFGLGIGLSVVTLNAFFQQT